MKTISQADRMTNRSLATPAVRNEVARLADRFAKNNPALTDTEARNKAWSTINPDRY